MPSFYQVCFCGYSRTQKRYWCYDPTTRQYFTFVNVTFFEFMPYTAFTSPTDVQVTVPLPTLESSVVEGTSSASIAPTRLLQVYTHCLGEQPLVETQANATPTPADPGSLDLGLLIAFYKGKRFITVNPISSYSILLNYTVIITVPHWKAVMDEEI